MPDDSKPTPPPAADPAETPTDQPANPAGGPGLPADPLPDGTVPTVLAKGDTPSHDVKANGKRTITSVYRRADIMTTLFTFGGALLAASLIFGGYLYFTRPKASTAKPPTVSTLGSTDLTKLGNFFDGNSAGTNSQILTVNSASLFKNRVALNQDLKVLGAASVGGPTELGDLTVDKTSNLGVTNVRGQLTVSGPLNLQSPATLAAGGTVNGNFAVSGNGTFGGSLSAGLLNIANLQVSGTLNLAGHLVITGSSPSVKANEYVGGGASATVDGNDSAGTVTVNTGTIPNSINQSGGLLVDVTFHAAYGKVPHVIISPVGAAAGSLGFYSQQTNSAFTIGTATNPKSNTSYTFDYWVIQ